MIPSIFFLIVGPSGVGKDTLIDGARAALADDPRWVFATRTITRAADAGGERHDAMDDARFAAAERDGGFLITWAAHGHRYGLPASLADELRAGHCVVANGSRATVAALATRVPRLVVVSVDARRDALSDRIAGRGREHGDAIAARVDRSVDLVVPPGVERIDVENDGTVEEGIERFVTAIVSASRRLRVVRYPVDTWHERIAYLPPVGIVGASDYLGAGSVDIEADGRSIRAGVHVASTEPALAVDEIGLSRQAFEDLGVSEGTRVELRRATAPRSRDALRAKIRGKSLTEDEYARLFGDIVAGRYSEGEIAAFLVSATRCLDDDEVVAIAHARSSLMTPVRWDEPIVVDKHSMGGVPGSRITLIVIPIVAAHGLAIPKTSSRAITSAAGTADAMEVVARVDLTADEMRETVRRVRGCIAWNGRLNHSALDDVMNAITRPLGIDSNRWSVASILSKKLTAGSTHVIVDLPWGPQAKLRTRDEAVDLGRLFEHVGRALGLVVEAHATDGSAPIGRGIGPALEVRDVLQVLDNDPAAPRDLAAKAIAFASRILAWDPSIATADAGRKRAEELLHSGAAHTKFDEIVEAQGRRSLPARPGSLTHAVHASASGRVRAIDIAQVSEIARRAGAPIDKAAGVDLAAPIGGEVRRGDVLYTIHASVGADLEAAAAIAELDSGVR